MKKKNIINLIKYYSEKNDYAFRTEAYEIARDFDENGDKAWIKTLTKKLEKFSLRSTEGDKYKITLFYKIISFRRMQ